MEWIIIFNLTSDIIKNNPFHLGPKRQPPMIFLDIGGQVFKYRLTIILD